MAHSHARRMRRFEAGITRFDFSDCNVSNFPIGQTPDIYLCKPGKAKRDSFCDGRAMILSVELYCRSVK